MALSGIYVLNQTFEDIRDEVLERLQVIGDGETITAAMTAKVKKATNLLLKQWEAQGIHLWTYTEGSLFLQVGQAEYDFRDSDTMTANKFFPTTLSQDEIAGASTVDLVDVDNVANTDNIGIIDADGTLFWTTVNGAPAGNTVTLTDVLPTAVTSGSVVYTYKAVDLIPVRRILNVRRRESDDYEIPIVFESREDYFNLPNKSQVGQPIQTYYSRQETQGIMYTWPSPNRSEPVINFTYERELQIIVSDTDDFDIPSYWYEAVVMNIMDKVKYKFSTSPERKADIKQDAITTLDEALSFDDAVYPIEIKMQQYG